MMKSIVYLASLLFGLVFINLNYDGNFPAHCSASCKAGSCSAYNFSGGGVNCYCILGIFPKCKSQDLSQNTASFGDDGESIADNLIANLENSGNPFADEAIYKLNELKGIIVLGNISGDDYINYFNTLEDFESILYNNFSEDEIDSLIKNE